VATKQATKAKATGAEARPIGMPETAAPPRPGTDRIIKGEAAEILGVSIEQIRGLVTRGHLGVYRLPGCRPKYLRSEVEALARRSFRPATAGGDNAA
jgi:hypothetical protein